MAHVQRSGGVCRNELEVNTRRLLRRLATIVLAAREYRLELAVIGRRAQVEVNEAGPRNLDLVEFAACADMLDDLAGQVSRTAASRFRKPHCDIRREVPMALVPGALDRRGDVDSVQRIGEFRQLGQRGAQQVCDG